MDLKDVARGASYGMYAGIILGGYVAYFMGGGDSQEEFDEPVESDESEEPEDPGDPLETEYEEEGVLNWGIGVEPIFAKTGVSGGLIQLGITF